MGNFGKFILGLLIIAIVTFAYAFMTASKRSDTMGADIRSALSSAGHDWAVNDKSEMTGNVFNLAGIAPDDAARASALKIAKETTCSTCREGKAKVWHGVNDMTSSKPAPVAPTVSPYTLSGVKTEDGVLTLNGYVKSEEEKASILAEARERFPAGVIDRTLSVAIGQPDAEWRDVVSLNLKEMQALDFGRFQMEDFESNVSGQAATEATRDAINTMVGTLPGSYNGSASITVPGAATVTAGQSNSEAICQTLINDLNARGNINFSVNSYAIRGQNNFTLLDDLAAGANQCQAFQISVEGHTDSDGNSAANLALSKNRAASVMAYLQDKGVARQRLSSQGFGEENPIATNGTSEGKARNRRIEFVVSRSE